MFGAPTEVPVSSWINKPVPKDATHPRALRTKPRSAQGPNSYRYALLAADCRPDLRKSNSANVSIGAKPSTWMPVSRRFGARVAPGRVA